MIDLDFCKIWARFFDRAFSRPVRPGQGYFLKINIKSTQLQDLKVEKRRGQGSFMGF